MDDICITPNRPYLIAEHAQHRTAVIFQARCKRWDCPYCAAKNAAFWTARAVHGSKELAQMGYELAFVTVTSRPRLSPEQSIEIFTQSWPKLRDRIKRVNGKKYEFFLVPEKHKSGVLHAHMITTAVFSKRWVKDNAYASGLGYIADRQRLEKPEAAGGYVSKYLVKSLPGDAWPKGFRRVRTSQGWPQLPELEKLPGWEYDAVLGEGNARWEYYHLLDLGYRVFWTADSLAYGFMAMGEIPPDGLDFTS